MSGIFSDGFGYWLSGLLDGEGSFQIVPNRPGFICRAQIGLRADDSSIIEEIARTTGLGRVLLNRRPSGNPNRKPLSLWRVDRKSDCQALVVILDYYPLRTKKVRDYALWKEAVEIMASMTGVVSAGKPRDWEEVRGLKERLTDVRRYPDLLDPPMEVRSPVRPGA